MPAALRGMVHASFPSANGPGKLLLSHRHLKGRVMSADPSEPSGRAVTVAPSRDAPGVQEERPVMPPREDAPAGEVDLWWGSYSGRAMVPSFAGCLTLTLGLVIGACWVVNANVQEAATARHECYALAAALWLFQVVRWAYRVVGFNYRLTTRRLLWGQGFLYPPAPPVELADVKQVRTEQTWLEHRLDIGRVIVTASSPEPVVLAGVLHPQRAAERIEQARRTRGSDDRSEKASGGRQFPG